MIAHCEWVLDAYDTRNKAPSAEDQIGEPMTKMKSAENGIRELLREVKPRVHRKSLKLHAMRRLKPGEKTHPARAEPEIAYSLNAAVNNARTEIERQQQREVPTGP